MIPYDHRRQTAKTKAENATGDTLEDAMLRLTRHPSRQVRNDARKLIDEIERLRSDVEYFENLAYEG